MISLFPGGLYGDGQNSLINAPNPLSGQIGNPSTNGNQGLGTYQGPNGPVYGWGPGTTTQGPNGPVTGIPNQPPGNYTPTPVQQLANWQDAVIAVAQKVLGLKGSDVYDALIWIFLFVMLLVGVGAVVLQKAPVDVITDAAGAVAA